MDDGLDRAVEAYIALEREIARRMPPVFGRCCAACAAKGEACCRPDVGQEAVESWWFRTVSTAAHGEWIPPDAATRTTCAALGPDGCCLVAGRPLICSSYFCEKLMTASDDPWELLLLGFLSDLPGYATRLTSRVNLALLESAEQARPYAKRVAQRFAQARRLLDASAVLADPAADEARKYRTALRLVCHHPRFLRPMLRRRLLELLPDAPLHAGG